MTEDKEMEITLVEYDENDQEEMYRKYYNAMMMYGYCIIYKKAEG